MLWFSQCGFNAWSVPLLGSNHEAALAAVTDINTTLAAGAAGIAALVVSMMIVHDIIEGRDAHYDLNPAMDGVLSGLVAITAGCSVVEPWAVLMIVTIVMIGDLLRLFGSWCLIQHQIDDAENAVPVPMFWGCLGGTCSASACPHRRGSCDIGNLLGAQSINRLFIIGWTTFFMLVLMVMLMVMLMLCPSFPPFPTKGCARLIGEGRGGQIGQVSFHGGLPGAGGDAFVAFVDCQSLSGADQGDSGQRETRRHAADDRGIARVPRSCMPDGIDDQLGARSKGNNDDDINHETRQEAAVR